MRRSILQPREAAPQTPGAAPPIVPAMDSWGLQPPSVPAQLPMELHCPQDPSSHSHTLSELPSLPQTPRPLKSLTHRQACLVLALLVSTLPLLGLLGTQAQRWLETVPFEEVPRKGKWVRAGRAPGGRWPLSKVLTTSHQGKPSHSLQPGLRVPRRPTGTSLGPRCTPVPSGQALVWPGSSCDSTCINPGL